MECVEIMTAVSRRTLDPLLSEVTDDFKTLYIHSPLVTLIVPKEHLEQLAHQNVTCGLNLGIYIWTSEMCVLSCLLLYCDSDGLRVVN